MPRLNEAESKSIEPPNVNGNAKTQPKSDRLSKGQELAQQSVKTEKGALVSKHQEQMLKLASALNSAERLSYSNGQKVVAKAERPNE